MKIVLFVDDMVDYFKNLQRALLRAGYHVLVASSGETGLNAALSVRPDLILMDLFMPEFDGNEVARKIRQEGSLRDVPILFLTSAIASDFGVLVVDGKDYPVVSKTASVDRIIGRVGECLLSSGSDQYS